MDYTIWYILGGLFIIWLLISINQKKTSRRRRSRTFMEGYTRKDKKEKEERDR